MVNNYVKIERNRMHTQLQIVNLKKVYVGGKHLLPLSNTNAAIYYGIILSLQHLSHLPYLAQSLSVVSSFANYCTFHFG